MNFPIAIHKDKESDFGVTVPDLPGCFSAGSTMEEALENAREAILTHVEGLLMDQEPVPQPSTIETYQKKKEFKSAVWAIVGVDLSELSGKAIRVNVTIPERILNQIDGFAKKRGESRSGVLVSAAMEYISAGSTK